MAPPQHVRIHQVLHSSNPSGSNRSDLHMLGCSYPSCFSVNRPFGAMLFVSISKGLIRIDRITKWSTRIRLRCWMRIRLLQRGTKGGAIQESRVASLRAHVSRSIRNGGYESMDSNSAANENHKLASIISPKPQIQMQRNFHSSLRAR